jgi:hypothetical protein
MKDGLLPIVAVMATVLLWRGMSALDPYWPLIESAYAPVFEQNQGPGATLTNPPLEHGNADTGSMNPSSALSNATSPKYGIPGALPHPLVDTDDTAVSVPMIAPAPPVEPRTLSDPGIDLNIDYGPPRASVPARVDLGSDITALNAISSEVVVALAPTPLPVPMTLRDRVEGAATLPTSGDTLDPFFAPAPPAQPGIVAFKSNEDALALTRSQRIEVQRRLALAGFNPRGIDGVFGLRTRGAITDFQTAWGFPATGYLEPSLLDDLTKRTEDAYQAWRHQMAARNTAPEVAPAARERTSAIGEGEGKCARDAIGRIVERQSLACDIAGFAEKFISQGRNFFER